MKSKLVKFVCLWLYFIMFCRQKTERAGVELADCPRPPPDRAVTASAGQSPGAGEGEDPTGPGESATGRRERV